MIKENSIQEVLETAKVEDIVQDYVRLKRRGANLIGLCPFHSEKTPSFTVSPSKNLYKCFGCGEGGDAVKFLMEYLQLSFPEAIRHLAGKYGIELQETGNTEEALAERQYLDSLYIVNQYARDYYQQQLFDTDRGRSVGLNYFKERGFREETIRKFGLGYAPDGRDTFTRQALSEGHDIELLRKLGLTTQYDRDFFRGRVLFAIHNLSGKVIGFGGRILNKDVKAPKYINTPETDIYHKSKVLYGAFFAKRAIRKEDECILVEGYTDVVSLHQAGIENVVAASGTSLTEEQIRLIKRLTPNIKMLFDGDFAGTKAALRGLDLVLEQDLNVQIVMLPEGEDPDSYLQQVGATAFREYIDGQARDFILFKAELLLRDAAGDPIKKTNAIRDIVGSIARIPDPIKRSLFIQECAKTVEVDEQLLVNEVNKLVGQQLRKRVVEDQSRAATPEQPAAETRPETGARPGRDSEKNVGDQFQEKDIVRILIAGGDKWFDEADQLTVAAFILSNIEDVLEEFDSPVYQLVVKEAHRLLLENKPVTNNFFLHHPDEHIQKLAVDLLSSPYEYSENWAKRWEISLTQGMPEENFHRDALYSLRRFKLRKLDRMIRRNKVKIREAFEGKSDDYMIYLKVDQHLKEKRNQLAKDLGTVVLK